jgi:hypothetical protein
MTNIARRALRGIMFLVRVDMALGVLMTAALLVFLATR